MGLCCSSDDKGPQFTEVATRKNNKGKPILGAGKVDRDNQ